MIEWDQKSKRNKIPRTSNKTPKRPEPKPNPQENPMPIWVLKNYPERIQMLIITQKNCILFAKLWGHDTTGTVTRIIDCFEYPKKSLLKSSHPKNTCHISYPKRSQKPQKILRSSPSLGLPVDGCSCSLVANKISLVSPWSLKVFFFFNFGVSRSQKYPKQPGFYSCVPFFDFPVVSLFPIILWPCSLDPWNPWETLVVQRFQSDIIGGHLLAKRRAFRFQWKALGKSCHLFIEHAQGFAMAHVTMSRQIFKAGLARMCHMLAELYLEVTY